MLRADFDAVGLVVDVKYAFLNFLIYFPSSVDEGFFHIGSCLGRCFHEDKTMFTGKGFTLLLLYLTS